MLSEMSCLRLKQGLAVIFAQTDFCCCEHCDNGMHDVCDAGQPTADVVDTAAAPLGINT